MKRQEWRDKPGDTPQIADGYAMMPYQGAVIAWDTDGGMVCLTDLWRAAGSPANKEPATWLRQESAKEYIEACRRQGLLMIGNHSENVYSRQGSHAGSWRERIVALEFARYLNPDLAVACNQFVLEKWGQMRQGNLADQDRVLLRAVAEHLGVLPRMEAKIDGIGQTLAGAEHIKTTEYHRGRIYIGLLTEPLMIGLVRRDLRWMTDGSIVFVGQTKPGEGQEKLRIRDYGAKITKLRPSDYQVLAAFDTDDPDACENLLLTNPVRGATRAILENGKKSLSFHIASGDAIAEYRRLNRSYYAVVELQTTWVMTSQGPLQTDMFSLDLS